MKTMLTRFSMTAAALLLLAPVAQAQPGPGPGPGPGRGMGRGMGPRGCGLMHAPPDVLKARFGLTDDQVTKIDGIRVNFLKKQITYRAEIQKLRLEHRQLFQSDLPNEGKVLQAMRKTRGLRGKLAEERVKTHLKIMATLTKEQRTKIRTECGPMMGPKGWGHGGKGWGRGRGWGHGGKGWGRGRGGPGGPGW